MAKLVKTDKGASGYSSTDNPILDALWRVSFLRSAQASELTRLFKGMYKSDPLHAIRFLFFLRDVRGGLGERKVFREMYKAFYALNPQAARFLLPQIPEYGRFDDVWQIFPAEDIAGWVKERFTSDLEAMSAGRRVSLLAKWLPSVNTSSAASRKLACRIAGELGLSFRTYRRSLSALRAHLRVVEPLMCAGKWGDINYAAVPSRANVIYGGAFSRHDAKRRAKFLEAVLNGREAIHSEVLYPYEVVFRYVSVFGRYFSRDIEPDATLEALWQALPSYSLDGTLCVLDGSGSMGSRITGKVTALDVGLSLAIYCAERASGPFHNTFVTFSRNPQLVDLKSCGTLLDKIQEGLKHTEADTTAIDKVFLLLLQTAVDVNAPPSCMPAIVLILSDMQFDEGLHGSLPTLSLFEELDVLYRSKGYKLPKLVFWCISKAVSPVPMLQNELGVILVSGFSQHVLKLVLSGEFDPLKAVYGILDGPRYASIIFPDEAVS